MSSPLAVIFATVTLDLVGFGMVVPLLPLYAQTYGASGTAVAVLLASYSLMQFLFAPLWGSLSDRIGRRPVLLTCIVGNAVSLLGYALAPTFAWLLVARLAAGMCNANISVANAYVADVTSPEQRARGMGLVGAAFGIGFVVGPALGGELGRHGFATVGLVAAALSLTNAAAAWMWLPESLPVAARRRGGGSVWAQRWQVMRGRAFPALVLGLIFTQVLGFSMLEMALALFAERRLAFDAAEVGRLFAYMGVVLVLVQGGMVGRLSRRWGECAVVWLGLGALTLGLALTAATPPGGVAFLLSAMAVTAAGQGLCSPALSSLLSKRAAADAQGATLGLGQSLSSLARTVGPQMAGVAYDQGGEKWPFLVGAVLMGLAWFAAILRLRPAAVGS